MRIVLVLRGHESLAPDTVVFTFVPESSKKTERKDVYLSVESVQAYLVDKVYSGA